MREQPEAAGDGGWPLAAPSCALVAIDAWLERIWTIGGADVTREFD